MYTKYAPALPHSGTGRAARGAALLVLLGALAPQAGSVITTACCQLGGTRSVTLRVGTATAGVIDTVAFTVGGGAAGNSLPTQPNPHGNGVAVAAAGAPVAIVVNVNLPAALQPQQVTTTVTSPASLVCISGPCGAATIPFSSISWTVGATTADDFQSGTFTGGSQIIQNDVFAGFTFIIPLGGRYQVSNTMSFSYANTTAYPAGVYRGTVVYTATLP